MQEGEPEPLAATSRPSQRLTVGVGRIFLGDDFAASDELSTLGLEVSSDAAFHGFGRDFGWELGVAISGDEIDASNAATGLQIQGDIDLAEIYAGLRSAFQLGPVDLHAGAGVSYVDLDVDSVASIPLTARLTPDDALIIQDSTVGLYLQLGAYLPFTDWLGVGIAGRIRDASNFRGRFESADGSTSTLGLTLHLFR